MKTFVAKPAEVEHKWCVVDAAGVPVGRLAALVAARLRGKHKPIFTPHVDCGDYIIVVNAGKVVHTGYNKAAELLYRHSGYPGGLKSISRGGMLEKQPDRYVEKVIRGMIPHTRLGDEMFRKLKVYAGPDHPHASQLPEMLEIPRR